MATLTAPVSISHVNEKNPWLAFDEIIRKLEGHEKTKKSVAALKADPQAFSFLMNYHGTQKKVERNLWLFGTILPPRT